MAISMNDSIFKQIIDSLPPDPAGMVITLMVAIGIGVGALTALLGALHSRLTISLLMLCVGAALGLALPGSLGIDVNRSIAIGVGSVVFGILGFALHRTCVAVALGTLVAAVALVIMYDQTTSVGGGTRNAVNVSPLNIWETLRYTWDGAPAGFRSLAPWVASGAFFVAGLLAMFLPKFGMAALYSLGGTMLTLFCIRLAHASDKIHWLDSIKTGPMTMAALGIAMLLVGFMTQSALLYRPTASPARKNENADATA